MNIFERIQHDTGLENYCTDILVGILQKSPILLKNFCVVVLGVQKESLPESLEINPQVHYKGINEDEKKSYVDIVISGTNFLCFLEMKVESNENYGQLRKYHKVLIKDSRDYLFLRFCTKYEEEIEIADKESFIEHENNRKNNYLTQNYFQSIRWYNIHNFLKEFCYGNALIDEFLEFLEMNMMSDKELVYNENEALSFYENLEIFNYVLKDLKLTLSQFDLEIVKKCFEIKTTPTLLFRHKRFGYSFKPYVDERSSEYWTGIFIGFEFTNDGILCKLDFWSKNKSSKIKEFSFKTYNKENDTETIRQNYNPNIGIVTYRKLEKSGKKISDIRKWFTEELQNIQEIKIN